MFATNFFEKFSEAFLWHFILHCRISVVCWYNNFWLELSYDNSRLMSIKRITAPANRHNHNIN